MKTQDTILEKIIHETTTSPRYQTTIKTVTNKFKKHTKQNITQFTQTHTQPQAKEIIKEWETHLTTTLTPPTVRTYTTIIKTIIKKAYQQTLKQATNTKQYTNQDIKNDQKFQTFLIQKQNITHSTQKSYITTLTHFCNHTQKTLTQFINETQEQQTTKIKNNTIIEYNPNNSPINDTLTTWYIQLQKTHKTNSIQIYQTRLRAFLKTFQIQLPPKIQIRKTKPKWKPLTKQLINTAIKTSHIQEKALYTFMASTGIRSIDVRNFTIGDFMKATSDQHQSITVDDFIYNAPQDMIGYWEFTPIKTQTKNIECKVFNTPESSNYIIEYLQDRKTKLNLKNKENNTNYTLTRKHPLFAPYKTNTNQKYTNVGFQYNFQKTNIRLKDKQINIIKNKLRKKEIDTETYYDLINNIPSFTPHQLRRYAISVFANNGVDLRVSALFEGHKPPIITDNSYVQLNKNILKNNYYKCIKDLSFEPTEVKVLSSDERVRFREFYDDLMREIELIKQNVSIDDANIIRDYGDDLFDF